jgi:hypothetical protein
MLVHPEHNRYAFLLVAAAVGLLMLPPLLEFKFKQRKQLLKGEWDWVQLQQQQCWMKICC